VRYLEDGAFRHHPLMRLTLGLTLLFLLVFWLTNALLYFNRMDLTPDSVQAHYLGSEADFTPPRTYASMLEVTHAHMAMMAIVLLLVTHLLIFAPHPEGRKRALIYATFGSGLANEAAGWLVRFVHPAFAALKLLAFLSFQLLLAYCMLSLVLWLRSVPGRGHPAHRYGGSRP